jgi:hypothetical protein
VGDEGRDGRDRRGAAAAADGLAAPSSAGPSAGRFTHAAAARPTAARSTDAMTRLFLVECRRNLARRLTFLLVVAFVVVTVVGIGIAWFNIETYSDADVAQREQQSLDQCEFETTEYGIPSGPPATFELEGGDVSIEGNSATSLDQLTPDEAREFCAEQLALAKAGRQGTYYFYYDDPRPSAVDFWDPDANNESFFGAIQMLIVLVTLGAAASMIGAEWKAGTITTQLTWSPDRIRVFLVKTAAAVVLAVAIAFVLQVVFALLVIGLIAVKDGVMDAADAAWWANLMGGIGRGCFLVGVGAALCSALAMLFRNTAGAVIVVFAYVAVAEGLIRAWQPDWEPWLVGTNLAIVLRGRAYEFVEFDKDPLPAALTLLAYVAVAVAVAAAAFRTRDIAGAS